METQRPFRVLIVGGGLVGLTAAHVFSRAGIDFRVLEKHESVLCPHGTTLALWPQTLRIFDQMGLLRALQPLLQPVEDTITLSSKDSHIMMKDGTMPLIKKNHGHGITCTARSDMVKFLYESLPMTAKSLVLTKMHVVDIETLADGVKVVCADGSQFEGSIVVGADGVHSSTRLVMRALKADEKPEDLPEPQKYPYISTYRALYGHIPVLPGLASNTRYDGAHNGLSTQITTGTDIAWYSVYEKIKHPESKVTKYTETDKASIMSKWGHLYMAPGWKVRDVNAHRIGETVLINLEEGLIDDWFFERIILVGDAVRKLEPHAGLGYNCGVTDLVVLVNGLRRLLRNCSNPCVGALEHLFQTYERKRLGETKKMAEFSMKTVRLLAWLTWRDKITAKYLMTNFPLSKITFNTTIGSLISKTPVLEWLEEGALPKSLVAWKHHPSIQRGQEFGDEKEARSLPHR
ncbi:putative monooxygenase [Annulohypoxylon stygium]|nr:putative monooxygenase [Annulohypoxylon stygium]